MGSILHPLGVSRNGERPVARLRWQGGGAGALVTCSIPEGSGGVLGIEQAVEVLFHRLAEAFGVGQERVEGARSSRFTVGEGVSDPSKSVVRPAPGVCGIEIGDLPFDPAPRTRAGFAAGGFVRSEVPADDGFEAEHRRAQEIPTGERLKCKLPLVFEEVFAVGLGEPRAECPEEELSHTGQPSAEVVEKAGDALAGAFEAKDRFVVGRAAEQIRQLAIESLFLEVFGNHGVVTAVIERRQGFDPGEDPRETVEAKHRCDPLPVTQLQRPVPDLDRPELRADPAEVGGAGKQQHRQVAETVGHIQGDVLDAAAGLREGRERVHRVRGIEARPHEKQAALGCEMSCGVLLECCDLRRADDPLRRRFVEVEPRIRVGGFRKAFGQQMPAAAPRSDHHEPMRLELSTKIESEERGLDDGSVRESVAGPPIPGSRIVDCPAEHGHEGGLHGSLPDGGIGAHEIWSGASASA